MILGCDVKIKQRHFIKDIGLKTQRPKNTTMAPRNTDQNGDVMQLIICDKNRQYETVHICHEYTVYSATARFDHKTTNDLKRRI